MDDDKTNERTLAICPSNHRLATLDPIDNSVRVSSTVDTTTKRVAHWETVDLAANSDAVTRHTAFCRTCGRELEWDARDLAQRVDDLRTGKTKKPLVLKFA